MEETRLSRFRQLRTAPESMSHAAGKSVAAPRLEDTHRHKGPVDYSHISLDRTARITVELSTARASYRRPIVERAVPHAPLLPPLDRISGYGRDTSLNPFPRATTFSASFGGATTMDSSSPRMKRAQWSAENETSPKMWNSSSRTTYRPLPEGYVPVVRAKKSTVKTSL